MLKLASDAKNTWQQEASVGEEKGRKGGAEKRNAETIR